MYVTIANATGLAHGHSSVALQTVICCYGEESNACWLCGSPTRPHCHTIAHGIARSHPRHYRTAQFPRHRQCCCNRALARARSHRYAGNYSHREKERGSHNCQNERWSSHSLRETAAQGTLLRLKFKLNFNFNFNFRVEVGYASRSRKCGLVESMVPL
jgi:hypothetical protein